MTVDEPNLGRPATLLADPGKAKKVTHFKTCVYGAAKAKCLGSVAPVIE